MQRRVRETNVGTAGQPGRGRPVVRGEQHIAEMRFYKKEARSENDGTHRDRNGSKFV